MRRVVLALGAAVLVLGAFLITSSLALGRGGREVEVPIFVKKFEFSPPRVTVNAGDRITFRIRSLDITHGFAIDGTGVDATVLPGREVRVTVAAEQAGKIRFRCSVVCGSLHPFMLGEIIVRPNRWPLSTALVGLGVALLAGATGGAGRARAVDLLRWRPLRWALGRRWLQFAVVAPNLLVFVVIVTAGLVGTATGAMNFSTIFVWLGWWGLLVLVLVPLGGRAWCAMCPIPVAGEWLARGAVVERRIRPLGLERSWPRVLRTAWPAFGGLLLLVLFGLVVTTRPFVTALLLLGFTALALVTHLVFERRLFCHSLCPVGGLVGAYAPAAPIELLAKDLTVCRACADKACFRGSTGAYPCPTLQFPGSGQVRASSCILCGECVKACVRENVALRLRAFGAGLVGGPLRRADEAWIVLLLLGSALTHSVVKLGHWGWIKSWANLEDVGGFVLYAAAFLAVVLGALPGLTLLAAWSSRAASRGARPPLRRLFLDYTSALVPVSLAAWMAFTLALVAPNLTYLPRVLSDPFGWGWDLIGTRDVTWSVVPAAAVPWAQALLVIAGLGMSIRTARAVVEQALGESQPSWALVPVAAVVAGLAGAFLALYLG